MESKKRLIGSIEFENESIIITDPCYLQQFKDEKGRYDKWDNFCNKLESQWNRDPMNDIAYKFECEQKGVKPEYKRIKPAYHDEHMMVSSTIYGDWSCTVYNCSYEELQNRIVSKQRVKKSDIIGKFCADAGLVCVCSAKHYSMPENFSDWVYTIIPNFTGIISFYIIVDDDGDDDSLIVEGEGNVNFCSTQTGF